MTPQQMDHLRLIADEVAVAPQDSPLGKLLKELSDAVSAFTDAHDEHPFQHALDHFIDDLDTWLDEEAVDPERIGAWGLIAGLNTGIAIGYRFAQSGGSL